MAQRALRAVRHTIGFVAFFLPLLLTLLLRRPQEQKAITIADNDFVIALNYIGDASFALTGALAAGLEGLDLLGCVIVGFTTALGGGTFRDLMLGRTPLFWLAAWDEALLCICVSTATFFAWPLCRRRLRLTTDDEWLFWTDTLGLGVFAANGAHTGFAHVPRIHFAAAACCGMFTATFGGATRDVLLRRPVRILHSHAELYAIPALLGGLATRTWLQVAPTDVKEALLLGIWVTVEARVLALNHGLRLPTYAEFKGAASDANVSCMPQDGPPGGLEPLLAPLNTNSTPLGMPASSGANRNGER